MMSLAAITYPCHIKHFWHISPCLWPLVGISWFGACLPGGHNWDHHRGTLSLKLIWGSGHYKDVIMDAMASQITSLTIVYSAVFRRRSKKTSKLCVTGLCEGNSTATGEFPAQMASNAENVSIWWRHHVPQVSSTAVQSSNELQILDHMTGYQDSNSTSGHQGTYMFQYPFFPSQTRKLTHWPLGNFNEIFGNFQANLNDSWLRYPLWKCPLINATGPY